MNIKYYSLVKAKKLVARILAGVRHFERIEQRKMVKANYKESPKYLNVGGGDFIKEHWRIIDYITNRYHYNPVFIDFNIDLEKCCKWPIEDESYDLVYTSHTLEHLSDKAVNYTLREIHRILKKDKGLRIAVPDIDMAIMYYKSKNLDWFEVPGRRNKNFFKYGNKIDKEYLPEAYLIDYFASHLVERGLDWAKVRKDFQNLEKEKFLDKYKNMIRDDWQRKDPGHHRNWHNFEKLKKILEAAGFRRVLKSACKKSIFVEFWDSEFDTRWPYKTLYIDAIK